MNMCDRATAGKYILDGGVELLLVFVALQS